MSDYGLRVRNQGGDVVIDSQYRNMALLLEQQLDVRTEVGYYTINFAPVTTDAPPVLAVRRWSDPALFFSTVDYLGGPGNWTGVRLTFNGLDRHAGAKVWVRLYAYDLPPMPGYGMKIRNAAGQLVFDSARLPLTFIGELGGRPQDWTWTSGRPLANAGRMDLYRPSAWNHLGDVYIAVGLALDLELGVVRVNGNPYRALVAIRWGFSADGVPILWQDARAEVAYAPGIPAAVYYSMPALPIIRV